MKQGIHPEYDVVTVTCSCGNSFETKSAVGDLKVEICSECHPYFTGKQKVIDSAGRIDKFRLRYGGGEKESDEKGKKNKKEAKAPKSESKPKKKEAKAEKKSDSGKKDKAEAEE